MAGAHDRRPAAWGEAAAAHIVGAQAGLVPPEDRALLPSGLRHDGRIVLPQPAPHGLRRLLIGPSERLLGREAPARQIGADGAHRQPDPTVPLDQHPHRRPAPQGEGQTEFVGRVPADQSADLRFLLGLEKPSRAGGRAPRPAGQSGQALLGEAAADIEYAGPGQAHLRGNGIISQAALAQADHLSPTLLLRCCWQLAHVDMFHPAKLDRLAARFQDHPSRINSSNEWSGHRGCSTASLGFSTWNGVMA